ncbi:HET-domain-containing protein, partial [Mytilinidion resinicola]
MEFHVFLPNYLDDDEYEKEPQDYQEHPALPVWSPVLEHKGSEPALRLAKRWLRQCLKEHPECADTRCVRLPDRLLYIRTRDFKSRSFEVQLVETDGAKGCYVALSHCWGKVQPLKTRNEEDLKKWKKGIPWAELPRTFQDSIQITAFLGYRYIWIDSICIVQGDQDDWERQSAQMGRYYESSVVTIVAASASGHEQGILVRKNLFAGTVMLGNDFSDIPVRFQEPLVHKMPWFANPIDPIDMRAWAYQERLLSPRSLVYSTQEMKWECDTSHCCECGMDDTRFRDGRHDYHFRGIAQCTKAEALDVWYERVVPVYSRRDLTQGTDKLPALSGVVAKLSERIGGRYLGGIWEDDFIYGLSWRVSHENWVRRPIKLCPKYQAPSFSWASISCEGRYPAKRVE